MITSFSSLYKAFEFILSNRGKFVSLSRSVSASGRVVYVVVLNTKK